MDNNEGPKSFLKLNEEECQSKLRQMVEVEKFHLWRKGEPPIICRPRIYDEDEQSLLFESINIKNSWNGEELLCCFNVKQGAFYCKVGLQEGSERFTEGKIIFTDEIYKLEKRQNERLLAFPHIGANLYIPQEKQEAVGKLLVFNRSEKDHEKKFRTFVDEVSTSKRNDQSKDMKGYRVLDLSITGASLLAKTEDMVFFENDEPISSCELELEGISYNIPEFKVVSVVDYINPSAKNLNLKKVGIEFTNVNQELKEEIERTLGDEFKLVEMSEFEALIDE